MSKQDDYLDNAAQTLNLASNVSKLAQSHVLDLAEKWVELPIGAIAKPSIPRVRLKSIRWLSEPSARFQPTRNRSPRDTGTLVLARRSRFVQDCALCATVMLGI